MKNKKDMVDYILQLSVREGMTDVCESIPTGKYIIKVNPRTGHKTKLPIFDHRFTSFASIADQIVNGKNDNFKKDLMKFYTENCPEKYEVENHNADEARSKLKKTLLIQAISRIDNDQFDECFNCLWDYGQYLSRIKSDQIILDVLPMGLL